MNGRVLGAVRVGGASSRFGSDKALADWHGEPLAAHAAAALAPFCAAVIQVGGADVPDRPRAGLGPLGGIAGALAHAAAHGFDTVLTIACDMPRVPAGLVEALLYEAPACCADAPVLGHWPAALAADLAGKLAIHEPSSRPRTGIQGSANRAVVGHAEPWMPGQPFAALPTTLRVAETLDGAPRHDGAGERHRRDGDLSVRRWAESIGALPIAAPHPLANVNTPADLLAL